MRLRPLLVAAVLAAAVPAAARTPAACQALGPGVNTLKGVLHEFHAAAGSPGSQFVLQLERPLCTPQQGISVTGPAAGQLNGRMLALAFPGGDPRRFVGRRVLVSGALLRSKGPGADGPVLQVGSFAPLPRVAEGIS
jgi:hypothetical protein